MAKGYRVIVPHLRGYGSTRFLSDETLRNGQQSTLASDIVALMDALKIEKAIVAGFDWGARTANIIAVHHILIRILTQRNSPASIRTEPSMAVSDIICRRKHPKRLPMLSSKLTAIERQE